jgi:ribosomal protein S12 methylthiotransferase
MSQRFYVETLGCPKNQVDSDKLSARCSPTASPTDDAGAADLVVVNTCAFIDEARRSRSTRSSPSTSSGATAPELVVTGCMAERYGDELAEALPEVDQVAGFGVPVTVSRCPPPARSDPGRVGAVPELDLLNLPRPGRVAVGVREDRRGLRPACGFCAIPSFRGPQRSRDIASILAEVDQLEAREIVLVAQDLAATARTRPGLGAGSIVPLVRAVADRVDRVRCCTCTRPTSPTS